MLGVHFAVTAEQERALLAAADDDTVGELIGDLEEEWSEDTLKVDTDKAWDPIHRSLTDGTLDPDAGDYPLSHAILGGQHLSDEIYAVFIRSDQVRDVAAALHDVDETRLRAGYDRIDPADYDGPHPDDFDYTWENLIDVRSFFDRAAAAGRAVLFTAS
jgi:hypothetical protein